MKRYYEEEPKGFVGLFYEYSWNDDVALYEVTGVNKTVVGGILTLAAGILIILTIVSIK